MQRRTTRRERERREERRQSAKRSERARKELQQAQAVGTDVEKLLLDPLDRTDPLGSGCIRGLSSGLSSLRSSNWGSGSDSSDSDKSRRRGSRERTAVDLEAQSPNKEIDLERGEIPRVRRNGKERKTSRKQEGGGKGEDGTPAPASNEGLHGRPAADTKKEEGREASLASNAKQGDTSGTEGWWVGGKGSEEKGGGVQGRDNEGRGGQDTPLRKKSKAQEEETREAERTREGTRWKRSRASSRGGGVGGGSEETIRVPYKWSGSRPKIHPMPESVSTNTGDADLDSLLFELDNQLVGEGLGGGGLRQRRKKHQTGEGEGDARGARTMEAKNRGARAAARGGGRGSSSSSSSSSSKGNVSVGRREQGGVKGQHNNGETDGLGSEDQDDDHHELESDVSFVSEEEDDEEEEEEEEDDEDCFNDDEVGFVVNKKKKREFEEEKQRVLFNRLAETVKELMKGLKESKRSEQTAQRGLRQRDMKIEILSQKVLDMQKEQDQLEEILQEAIAKGGVGSGDLLTYGSRGIGKVRMQHQKYDHEQRRDRLARKKNLLQDVDNEDDDVIVAANTLHDNFFRKLYVKAKRWLYHWLPLGPDIRNIQSQYGSSVASYFLFFRWLFGVYLSLAFPLGIWLLLHIYKLIGDGDITRETDAGVPWVMTYASFTSSERYTYCCLVLSFVLVQLLATLVKWIKEDRIRQESHILDLQHKHIQFSRSFLCSWDNSLLHQTEVTDFRYALGLNVIVMLSALSHDAKLAQRQMKETLRLWAIRSLAMIMYLALQLCAWSAIIYLTSQSQVLGSKLTKFLTSNLGLDSLGGVLASSIVPAAVSIINTVMPRLIVMITEKEDWDSDKMVMYMLTGRMYFAKILNAFIQALSYMLLANPYLLSWDVSIRENVEQGFQPQAFDCRLQQAAAGLFQLVLTEFVISKVIVLMIIYVSRFAAACSRGKYTKPEFEVARMMVSLLYFQALVLASFPLFPLGVLPICILMYLTFKWDKQVLKRYRAKPKSPWKAQDAGAFFIKFYLATLVVFGAINTYYTAIAGTFPKACDLQDLVAGLCSSAIADDDTCVMDTEVVGYQWFANECTTTGYPSCVCSEDQLCGPFVNSMSMWNPLDTRIRQWEIFGVVYAVCVDYNFLGWAIAILLYFVSYFAKNHLKVSQESAADRDRVWVVELHTAQAKLRKQTKRIQKLELQASLATGEDDV